MDREIFAAGVAPGSPNTQNEIKTLICYMLDKISKPITFEQLHESLRSSNLVNYFELIESLSSLVESCHITKTIENDTDYYSILTLGRQAANALDASVALSVKEKALSSLNMLLQRQKRLNEVTAEITPLEDGGYNLYLSIPDVNINLVSLNLFCPTIDQASNIKKSFLNDPVFIYKSIMSIVSGDYSILGDLKPSKDKLF